MKFCAMWRLIQYNPPWSGCGARTVSPVLVSARCYSVWCFSSLLLLPASQHTALGWHHSTCTKTVGQLSSLFHHSPNHLSQMCKMQARLKRECRAFLPYPVSLYLESMRDLSVQGNRANSWNVSGYHYLLCFHYHCLLPFPKPYMPKWDCLIRFHCCVWPFWIVTNKWGIGLLRSSVPANQLHISPLFLPPQKLMD